MFINVNTHTVYMHLWEFADSIILSAARCAVIAVTCILCLHEKRPQ